MIAYIYVVALVYACATAASPAPPLYPQPAPAQLQPISPYAFYSQGPGISNLYNAGQQKQGEGSQRGTPVHLETLEPDSEVEYIPGAQPPQQPPQQTPLTPNLPGLLPGQRVFIVHMPVPGYSPGSIAGYQPVYVVGAAPQGNPGYTPNGYQNGVFLHPSGQTISPAQGYPQPGTGGLAQPVNPGLVFGPAPFALNRPFNLLQQTPVAGYQPGAVFPEDDAEKGSLRLAQLVALQGPQAVGAAPGLKQSSANSDANRLRETSERLVAKGASEEAARGRPLTGAQIRKP